MTTEFASWLSLRGYTDAKSFQSANGLTPDGIVGPKTISAATKLGFSAPSAGLPPKPTFPSLNYAERSKIFGSFAFVPAPVVGNPEAIRITDDWAKKNITGVIIPQLDKISGAKGRVFFHQKAARQLQQFFRDIEAEGLLPTIITFDGGWVPRFVRGSRVYLSNHSFGTALDLNAAWNPLGGKPAPRGSKGSVLEIVDIALKNGLYWGGWFSRADPMHFEVFELQE